MGVDFSGNVNYTGLSAGEKTTVDAAVTAMRAAYAAVATASGKATKFNVDRIFKEVVRNQEES